MENERVLIATDRKTLKEVLREVFNPQTEFKPEFENDRLTKTQTAKLVRVSLPTLDRYILAGKFKKYGSGKKMFFLKSEVIEALRNNL